MNEFSVAKWVMIRHQCCSRLMHRNLIMFWVWWTSGVYWQDTVPSGVLRGLGMNLER